MRSGVNTLGLQSGWRLAAAILALALAGCGERPKLEHLASAQALERLPRALDEHSPRLMLLCIGGNDFLRRLGNAQAEANLRAMVKLARQRGVDVVLIGTPEPGLTLAPPAFRSIRTPAATASLPNGWPSG